MDFWKRQLRRTIFVGVVVVIMLILTFGIVDRNVKRRNLNGDWTYVFDDATKEKAEQILSPELSSLFNKPNLVLRIEDNDECRFYYLKGVLKMGFQSFECKFESGRSDVWFEAFGDGEKIGNKWVIKFTIQSDKEIAQLNKNGEPYMKLAKIVY